MRYEHRFVVQAPLEDVRAFHARSASLVEITPPLVVMKLHQAPEALAEGAIVDFTMWLGPIPVRWVSVIERVDRFGFTDRQLQGPFGHWCHRHTFEPEGDRSTAVLDTIEYRPRRHMLWGPVSLAMSLSLPMLFAFRRTRTRNLLGRLDS